jgi:hypothetical protein
MGKYPKFIHLTRTAAIGEAIKTYFAARWMGMSSSDIESRMPIMDTPIARKATADKTRAFDSEIENRDLVASIAHDGEFSGLVSGSKHSPNNQTTSARPHICEAEYLDGCLP